MKKTVKALLAAMLTLALAFATVGTAFAAQSDNGHGAWVSSNEEDVKAAITKRVDMGIGTTVPNATFTFQFTKDTTTNVDNEGKAIVAKNGPAIPNVTASISAATQTTTDNTNNLQYAEVETANFLQNLNFDSYGAGIYVYDVEELITGWQDTNPNVTTSGRTKTLKTTGTNSETTETMTYSGAKYKVFIYVADKAAGGTYIKAVGVVVKAGDDGSTTGGNTGNKVNPTPDDPTDPVFDPSDMVFKNTYNKTTSNSPGPGPGPDPLKKPLAIKKVVTAESLEKTKDFTFTVTLTKPGSYTENLTGKIYNSAGTQVGTDITFAATGTAQTVTLKDGYVLTFDNAPVGTKFNVAETVPTGWQAQSCVVKANNVTQTPTSNYESGLQTVGETPENSVVITNDQSNSTPTGIIMNNLPFVVMIGAAVVAIVALAVVKARKNAAE